MQTYSVHEFRANLKKVADSVTSRHEPVRISRRSDENLIIFSEQDWNAEQETLYVLQNQTLMKQIARSLAQDSGKTLTQEEINAEFGV